MAEEKKVPREKNKNSIGTYAVIMVLAAIVLIIIAAMADHREDHFETKISEQTEINLDIQDQIVNLEAENYNLLKQVTDTNAKLETAEGVLAFYQIIGSVYADALDGKPEDATEKLKKIDPQALGETEKAIYDRLQKQLQLDLD